MQQPRSAPKLNACDSSSTVDDLGDYARAPADGVGALRLAHRALREQGTRGRRRNAIGGGRGHRAARTPRRGPSSTPAGSADRLHRGQDAARGSSAASDEFAGGRQIREAYEAGASTSGIFVPPRDHGAAPMQPAAADVEAQLRIGADFADLADDHPLDAANLDRRHLHRSADRHRVPRRQHAVR